MSNGHIKCMLEMLFGMAAREVKLTYFCLGTGCTRGRFLGAQSTFSTAEKYFCSS